MELLASVSRSSGLQADGDELKKSKIQEEYREFIQKRLEDYLCKYPLELRVESPGDDTQRNSQSNILILFRKLREGLMASQRVDNFALEVYELSFFLSIIFRLPNQTTSISGQLIPHGESQKSLYELCDDPTQIPSDSEPRSNPSPSTGTARRGDRPEKQVYRPPARRQAKVLSLPRTSPRFVEFTPTIIKRRNTRGSRHLTHVLSLLSTLCHSYPSQASYHSEWRKIPRNAVTVQVEGKDTLHPLFQWLQTLVGSLATRNYSRFQKLSRPSISERLLPPNPQGNTEPDFGIIALQCLLADLRLKIQRTVWLILRHAYRELDTTLSSDWLVQCLLLSQSQNTSDKAQVVENWLSAANQTEVERKQGVEGRWILHK